MSSYNSLFVPIESVSNRPSSGFGNSEHLSSQSYFKKIQDVTPSPQTITGKWIELDVFNIDIDFSCVDIPRITPPNTSTVVSSGN